MPLRVVTRALAAALVLVAACRSSRPVVVGSKPFTEQRILGEVVAQAIEEAGLPVKRRFGLGDTLVCDAALRAGSIDAYVEYTGTALAVILHDSRRADASEVLSAVRDAYAAADLEWMRPLGFENGFALIARGDDAADLHLARVSDVGAHAGRLTVGVPVGFFERADGWNAFAHAYGLRFARVRPLDPPTRYDALTVYDAVGSRRSVDLVIGNATDGEIAHRELTVLADDKHFFPPYEAVPVVRRDTLKRHPELVDVLNGLGGALPPDIMRQLNWRVGGEGQSPAAVVRAFRKGPAA
jgi:osmoprotectant transport system substrate-binding protein